MKRIKHNDLTHYFLRPHEQLPRAYLASCEKFFKELTQKRIRENLGLEPGEVDDEPRSKRQASSNKQQATSGKRQAASNKLDKIVL